MTMRCLTIDEVNPQDAEFCAMVDALVNEYPSIDSKGFDLTKIKGPLQRRTAKAVVLHLTLSGWSVSQISEAIGVHPATVADNLESAIREAAPLDDVELLRDLALQRLGSYERLAVEHFHKSCEPKVTRTCCDGDSDGKGDQMVTRTEGQSGNPAYLRVLIDIDKRKAALLGLDQPTKMSIDKTTRQLIVKEIIVTNASDVAAAKAAGLLE